MTNKNRPPDNWGQTISKLFFGFVFFAVETCLFWAFCLIAYGIYDYVFYSNDGYFSRGFAVVLLIFGILIWSIFSYLACQICLAIFNKINGDNRKFEKFFG